MARNSVADWDTTASNNTDVGGINIAENCAAANINNAVREMMAQISTADFPSLGDNETVTGTWTFTAIADLGTVTTADINGGTVDGTAIGGTTPAAGAFTTLSASGNVTMFSTTFTAVSGADTTLLTGTAGTDGYLPKWNADGDLVDGYDVEATVTDDDTHIPTSGAVVDYVAAALTQILHVQHQETSGTAGGTFTNGAWQTRTLNTVVSNNISGASLSSNQVTLPAGTYRIHAKAGASDVDKHQARWQNVTDASTVLLGMNSDTATSVIETSVSDVVGVFTIAGSKAFELQHRSTFTNTVDGFGVPHSWGTEVYADVLIEKIG